MNIFISHPIKDEKLAIELKRILESSKKIKIAHIAQREKNFELEVSDKIIKQINESNYLIALITDDSYDSASVNQELGYAQGIGLSKIPLIEKTAKEGFLIYGKDKVEFTREDFQEKCIEIKKYILKNGIPNKISTEEETFMLKSSHYRQYLENQIQDFLNGLYYRFDIGKTNYSCDLGINNVKYRKKLYLEFEKFFDQKHEEVIPYLLEIDFAMYSKLDWELQHCKKEILDGKRFPNSELTHQETDLIVKLKEALRDMMEDDLDIEKYCKAIYHPDLKFDFKNPKEVANNPKYKHEIYNFTRYTFTDLKKVVDVMIKLLKLYFEYRQKFENTAFKTLHDF